MLPQLPTASYRLSLADWAARKPYGARAAPLNGACCSPATYRGACSAISFQSSDQPYASIRLKERKRLQPLSKLRGTNSRSELERRYQVAAPIQKHALPSRSIANPFSRILLTLLHPGGIVISFQLLHSCHQSSSGSNLLLPRYSNRGPYPGVTIRASLIRHVACSARHVEPQDAHHNRLYRTGQARLARPKWSTWGNCEPFGNRLY